MKIITDKDLKRLRRRVEKLRGLCKTAVGMLHDCEAHDDAQRISKLIGDMEPVRDQGEGPWRRKVEK